tara:strand:- start:363 stop:1163 length:801 start_codon:yes stop_codon:yes gene_type:complete
VRGAPWVGYKLFSFIVLAVTHLCLTVGLASLFFVILPSNGDYFGFALAQLWLVFVLSLGDRFLLSSLKAKRVNISSSLVQKVDNFRALKRFEKKIDIFSSKELSDNILIIDSYFRDPAIVVGEKLSQKLRPEDLDNLLKLCVDRFKTSRWSYACVVTQLLSVIAFPLILFTFINKAYVLNSLFSAPASLVTKTLLKIGGISMTEESIVNDIKDSYPGLWSGVSPRTSKHLSVFLSYVLDYFLLIPTDKSAMPVDSFGSTNEAILSR